MGHDQVAAARDGVHQTCHDGVRVIGVRDEVQDGDQQDGDRTAEVEGAGRAFEDGFGVAQVGPEVVRRAFRGTGQQGLGVGE